MKAPKTLFIVRARSDNGTPLVTFVYESGSGARIAERRLRSRYCTSCYVTVTEAPYGVSPAMGGPSWWVREESEPVLTPSFIWTVEVQGNEYCFATHKAAAACVKKFNDTGLGSKLSGPFPFKKYPAPDLKAGLHCAVVTEGADVFFVSSRSIGEGIARSRNKDGVSTEIVDIPAEGDRERPAGEYNPGLVERYLSAYFSQTRAEADSLYSAGLPEQCWSSYRRSQNTAHSPGATAESNSLFDFLREQHQRVKAYSDLAAAADLKSPSQARKKDITNAPPAGDKPWKRDSGKPRVDLLPAEALLMLGSIATYGAGKYGERNWEAYADQWHYGELVGAALRHILKWMSRQDLDEESNLPHLGHAAFNLMLLIALTTRGRGKDDRGAEQ